MPEGMPPKLSKETRTPLHNRFGQWHVRLRSGGCVAAGVRPVNEEPRESAENSYCGHKRACMPEPPGSGQPVLFAINSHLH